MLRNASHHARRNLDVFLNCHHLPACHTRIPLNISGARFASAASTTSRTNAASAEPGKRFRSKHYNPASAQPSSTKKPLEPHVLSARLKTLCDGGRINDAISLLKNSPLDAQNVPTWNTLIWECMKAKKFQVAYDLYVDMKRRGFSPTSRTFKTMLSGLARIENWPDYPKQLKNATSLYEAFLRHVDSVKKHDASSPELNTAPIASYIQILGDVGMHQEIFDVFYNMDNEGPLAPDHLLFTAMFQALAAKPDPVTGYAPNSASAKLLWSLMIKAQRKTQFPLDSHLISAAVLALSRGRPGDQESGFQIVRDYFGLSTTTLPKSKDTVPLTPQAFGAVLSLCKFSEKHQSAIDFFQQVLERPAPVRGPSIIDNGHVETVIGAYSALSSPNYSTKCIELLEWMLRESVTRPRDTKIRPSHSTYLLVLKACWSCADWRGATKTFDLMTGYHCHDFMDGVVSDRPRFDRRSEGRNISPDPETVSLMVRTAVRTKNRAHIRQALRLTHYLGMKDLFLNKYAPEGSGQSKKATDSRLFYSLKLADAVREGIEQVLAESTGKEQPRKDDVVRWKELERDATDISALGPSDNIIPTISVDKKSSRRRH